jgi:hypothetical protein
MAKKIDPLAAKAKKQKIFLAVGGVLLLLILFIQLPKVMGGSTPTASSDPAGVTTADGVATPPVVAGETSAPTTPPTATGLPEGTFRSFEVYGSSKNPFKPQVGEKPAPAAPAAAAPAPGTAPEPAAPVTSTPPVIDVSGPPAPAPSPSSPPPVAPAAPASGDAAAPVIGGTVKISVNGRVETLDRLASFPKSDPVFRIAKANRSVAKIGVIGGSYTAGGPLLTLKKGKPVTLLDTSTGKRYRLLLLSVR